ncbi:hypothetical protein K492DRAFT_145428, partial [Lichtheimia hyalospora FSU 10163]
DSLHTDENTLKLLEYTSLWLHEEKAAYQQASYSTFFKGRLSAIHCVGYKLALLGTFIGDDT